MTFNPHHDPTHLSKSSCHQWLSAHLVAGALSTPELLPLPSRGRDLGKGKTWHTTPPRRGLEQVLRDGG